jgi:hypothetical protein
LATDSKSGGFGFGADLYGSGGATTFSLATEEAAGDANTGSYEAKQGRGNTIVTDTPGIAYTVDNYTGIDYATAQQDLGILQNERASGRSTFSSADIEAQLPSIRTQITNNAVTDEILATMSPELRSAAEPIVEAEMRRLGRNPDETGQERDTRVAQEQQALQNGMFGLALASGAAGQQTEQGLSGALNSMAGKMAQEPQKEASNPFGISSDVLATLRGTMVDFGEGTKGFAAAMEANAGYSKTVAYAQGFGQDQAVGRG